MDTERIEKVVRPKLEHLTQEKRNDLYNRFYQEKNSVLIAEFQIKENANLHTLFEPKIIESVYEFCNVFMWEYYPPTSE